MDIDRPPRKTPKPAMLDASISRRIRSMIPDEDMSQPNRRAASSHVQSSVAGDARAHHKIIYDNEEIGSKRITLADVNEDDSSSSDDVEYLANVHAHAPTDKGKLAFIIFVILGIGVLLPWNALLAALVFFQGRFKLEGVDEEGHFAFLFSIFFNCSSIFIMFPSIKYGPKFSFTARILTALNLYLAALVAVAPLTLYVDASVVFWVDLGISFAVGCATAIMFGSTLGLVSLFPPRYTVGVMTGNGIAGLIAAAFAICTKVFFPVLNYEALQRGMAIYFSLSASIILVCILFFVLLLKLPITKYYFAKHKSERDGGVKAASVNTETTPLMGDESANAGAAKKVRVWKVFVSVWPHAFSVFFTFFITLSLFPGVTGMFKSIDPDFDSDWFTIIITTLFMVFDFLGRLLPRWITAPGPRYYHIVSATRVVFVFLMIICIAPRYITNDYAVYTIMAMFALTNGYFGTLSMSFAPSCVESHERETVGILMSFHLNLGIFLGTWFAMLLKYLIENVFIGL